jgi:hypothetical protein
MSGKDSDTVARASLPFFGLSPLPSSRHFLIS